MQTPLAKAALATAVTFCVYTAIWWVSGYSFSLSAGVLGAIAVGAGTAVYARRKHTESQGL